MSDDAQLALLTEAELHALAACEDTIRRGLTTFVEVGQALLRIRDERLYRAEHTSFEAYCSAKWSLSRAHAYRVIEAARVVDALSPMGDTITTERHLRPLLRDRPHLTVADVRDQL